MLIERKACTVADVKSDDESGTIEAIVSVFSNVDSGNEKVMPGFFAKSIAKKLPKGVWAHDWTQPIAKTLEAVELKVGDPRLPDHLKQLGGAYIKGQFNLKTQRGREAYEDIKFGIVDEFSIGYKVNKDNKADDGVRELIEGDWKEWSPVLVGMNDQTSLISIKSAKGMLSEQMAQTTPSIWEVESAFHRVVGKLAQSAKDASITSVTIDWRAKVTELISEYGPQLQPIIVAQIEDYLDSTDNEFYLKSVSHDGQTFAQHSTSVLAAVEGLVTRAQSVTEMRSKEGRQISTANRQRLQELHDALGSLLTSSEPPPKEPTTDALRSQTLRVSSDALAALAGT